VLSIPVQYVVFIANRTSSHHTTVVGDADSHNYKHVFLSYSDNTNYNDLAT